MKDDPLVSIILSVYNSERFLAESINSVMAQTYRPFELIVIDDGSTDNSARIAQSYAEIRYFWQENSGISAARNRGVELASGEYFAFQDADDIWLEEKLETQMRYLLDHAEIDFTICRTKFFLEEGCPIPLGFRTELLVNDHYVRLMQAMVARRSAMERVGAFDVSLRLADDVDWMARAVDLGIPMFVLPDVLLHKRVHDANNSQQVLLNNQSLLKALRRSVKRKRNEQ